MFKRRVNVVATVKPNRPLSLRSAIASYPYRTVSVRRKPYKWNNRHDNFNPAARLTSRRVSRYGLGFTLGPLHLSTVHGASTDLRSLALIPNPPSSSRPRRLAPYWAPRCGTAQRSPGRSSPSWPRCPRTARARRARSPRTGRYSQRPRRGPQQSPKYGHTRRSGRCWE